MSRQTIAVVAVALLLVAGVVPASTAAASSSSNAYTGTHVSFDVQGSTVTDYTVEDATVVQSIGVQSTSQAESDSGGGLLGAGGGLDLSATVNVDLAGLSLSTTTQTSATVQAESGATLTAHDENNGILVVEPGDESQVVVANLSTNAEASASGENQVEVTTADGTRATFIAVGNASVTVNEQGNVTGQVGTNGKVVLRAYPDGKTEAETQAEELIASGKAAGEVYAGTAAEAGAKASTSVVTYANETTMTAKQTGESTVNVTVDRTSETGKVLITSVSEAAVGTTENLDVAVSGGTAVEVSSYSDLEGALGSDRSAYMVKQHASGNATVFVAFNHFSERTASISGADDGSSGGDAGDDSGSTATSSGSSPGFGVVTLVGALVALAAVLFVRRE
ncbi:hypothetical protein [Halarchaeum salinum]|uniref:PGF-CTERM sorting domain-containing protein n=1 Tax=Halarchaeum salinum TaxID=489912 RepID=A0AAV3S497_9EURY